MIGNLHAKRKLILLTLGLLLLSSVGASVFCAGTAMLDNYKSRLDRSVKRLDGVATADDYDTVPQFSSAVIDAARFVRLELPEHEFVQAENVTIEVDNSWLSPPLADLERTDIEPRTKEKNIQSIVARLKALQEATLVENVAPSGAPDKDSEKAKLAEIKRRKEFSDTERKDPFWKKYWNQFWEWLRRILNKNAPAAVKGAPTVSLYARYLLYGLILLAVLFIVWKLLPFWNVARKREKLSIAGERSVLGEQLGPGQTPADLLAEAEALAHRGEMRAAIRKAYVALLFELADRKLLKLEKNKTNRDYLQNIQKRESLYGEVTYMTGRFERHWYGLAPASEQDWSDFRGKYDQALVIAGNEAERKTAKVTKPVKSAA